jgi:hypothetical protein
MEGLIFSKSKMKRFMEALRDGTPLSPSQSTGWSRDDMGHAVGAFMAGILSQWPLALPGSIGEFGEGELADAMKEETDGQFEADLCVMAMYVANLALAVIDGDIPEDFGETEPLKFFAKGPLPEHTMGRIRS